MSDTVTSSTVKAGRKIFIRWYLVEDRTGKDIGLYQMSRLRDIR
jgi:hypothetical protein